MALTWTNTIVAGSTKVLDTQVNEIIDNVDVLHTALQLTPPAQTKVSKGAPVLAATLQTIMNNVDIADNNNFCRLHNLSHCSGVLVSHLSVHQSVAYTVYDSTNRGTYDSGDDGTYNSSYNASAKSNYDGTVLGTHNQTYNSGYCTDRTAHNNGVQSSFNSSVT